MKLFQGWFIFICEVKKLRLILALMGFVFAEAVNEMSRKHISSLDIPGYYILILVIIITAHRQLFKASNIKTFAFGNNFATDHLEFFFTKAVDRKILFGWKVALFLFACCCPLMVIWFYSHRFSALSIELPMPLESSGRAADFYTSRFPLAYLNQNTSLGTEVIVFPGGQSEVALFLLVATLLVASTYQNLVFLFWKNGFLRWVIPVGFLLLIPPSDMFGGVASFYEQALAFGLAHLLWTTIIIFIVVFIQQLFCYKRFIATEVI